MSLINVGDYQEFNYTGDVQSLTTEVDGIYKLEVYGAQGGTGGTSQGGGAGGYSVGYKKLNSNTIVYVCVGGAGPARSRYSSYNGGGLMGGTWCGGGGGATHIAFVTGTLASIGKTSFVDNANGLIVAGGGGGDAAGDYSGGGGSGGGLTGGGASAYYSSGGGTQTKGGSAQSGGGVGSFGQGGSIGSASEWGGGGGGGLYGGGASWYAPGGGGSGWIDGVPEITYAGTTYTPSTSNGQRGGNGYAKITLMAIEYELTTVVSPVGSGTINDVKSENTHTLTATPSGDYMFDHWSYGSTTSQANPLTITLTSDLTVTAHFRYYELSKSVNPAGSGTINDSQSGNTHIITATANQGYSFRNWTIDSSTVTTNPYTFTLTKDTSAVANFNKIYNISVSVNPSGSGTATGAGTYIEGQQVTLVATPATNYRFVCWKVDEEVVSRNLTYSFTASADQNYEAKFKLDSEQNMVIKKKYLEDIAEAIRDKGVSGSFTPEEMSSAIDSI